MGLNPLDADLGIAARVFFFSESGRPWPDSGNNTWVGRKRTLHIYPHFSKREPIKKVFTIYSCPTYHN